MRAARGPGIREAIDRALACALCPIGDRGFFPTDAVRVPPRLPTRSSYDAWSCARHLAAFGDPARGAVVGRAGSPGRFRLRDLLLVPYVVMRGVAKGLAGAEHFPALAGS